METLQIRPCSPIPSRDTERLITTPCNLCGHQARQGQATDVCIVPSNVREFHHEHFTVWRCQHCRSLHALEPVDLDRYYERYPFKKHVMNFATGRAYHNRLRLLARRGTRKDSRILDYGCGAGLFIEYLRRQGYRNVEGYDAYAQNYADKTPLARRFDVIVSYDVIEHVEEPRRFFAALADRLDDGGLLVIGTPNANEIDVSSPDGFSMELHQPYHRHILSEQALAQLGTGAGLEVEDVYRRFYFDTLYPTVNTRFMEEYVRATGNVIDVVVEKPRPDVVLRSHRLLFHAFFGYFAPPPGNMMFFFRK